LNPTNTQSEQGYEAMTIRNVSKTTHTTVRTMLLASDQLLLAENENEMQCSLPTVARVYSQL